jgi:hypothetical protein
MRIKLLATWLTLTCFLLLGVAGCTGLTKPSIGSLKDEFVAKVKSSSGVKNFSRSGDQIIFTCPVGGGLGMQPRDLKVQLTIKSATVAPYDDAMKQYIGRIVLDCRKIGGASEFPWNGVESGGKAFACGMTNKTISFWGKSSRKWADWRLGYE